MRRIGLKRKLYLASVAEKLDIWFTDGKLAEVINNQVFDMKANQTDLDLIASDLASTSNDVYEFKNISNTDGAITNVINTGLSYVKQSSLFAYGTYQTLFRDAIKDENGYYNLDCSSFIQACFEGIPFENSKYINDKNYPVNTQFLFPEEPKKTYGRVLANQLGEYAYKNGWWYETKPDYSNVRVGDILFWHNSTSETYWKKISHVMLVTDVGDRGISVIHTVGTTGTLNPIRKGTYDIQDLLNNNVSWGARYPLRDTSNAVNLMNSNAEEVKVSESGYTIKELNFDTPLEEYRIYTAFIKVTPTDVNSYPAIWLGNNESIHSFYSYKRRPDNLYKVSFFIPQGVTDADKKSKVYDCRRRWRIYL